MILSRLDGPAARVPAQVAHHLIGDFDRAERQPDVRSPVLDPLLGRPLLSVLYPKEGETSPIDEIDHQRVSAHHGGVWCHDRWRRFCIW